MLKLAVIFLLYLVNASLAEELYSIALTLPLFLFIGYTIYNIRSKFIVEDDVLWFTVLLYFCIHPMQIIVASGIKPGAGGITFHYSDFEIVYAFVIVYLFLIAFVVARFTFFSKGKTIVFTESAPYEFILFLVTVMCFPIFVAFYGGIENLLSPRFLQQGTETSSLAVFPISLMSVATLMHAAHLRSKTAQRSVRTVTLVYFFAECLLLFICKNPLNTARFHLMIVWGPIFLTLIRGRIGGVLFYFLALIGIFVVFPVLSYSTRFGFRESELQMVGDVKFDPIELQSVDIFRILVHAVHFMQETSLYYGQKIAAVILWFAPRAFWPEKPIVGGLDVGGDLFDMGLTGTNNVSFFVAGDFWMDFGLPGVVGGGIIMGLIYYKLTRRHVVVGGQPLTRYIWICALPILVRGPLGATIGLFWCELVTLAVMTRVLGKRQRFNVSADVAESQLNGDDKLKTRLRWSWVGRPLRDMGGS